MHTSGMRSHPSASRGLRVLAAGAGGYALLAVVAAGSLAGWLRWSWAEALEAFVVSNGLIGGTLAGCGMIIAWHRPRNPIGWLFLFGGVAQSTSALMPPLGNLLLGAGAPEVVLRITVTLFAWCWPWSIGLCLPLALLLFPDGRPLSPAWRWVTGALVVTAPLFALEMGASPDPGEPGFPPGYLTLASYADLDWLWRFAEIRTLLALVAAMVSLVLRYRRGAESQRRQLLWLVLATAITLLATLPWGLVTGTPVVVLLSIALIPIAVTVAVIRHQLLDIRLVVSRALAWLLLSLAVVLAYAGLVGVLDGFVSAQFGRSAVATVLLVLVAAPVLPRLTRVLDRAVYGDRDRPDRIATRVGEQLVASGAGLGGVAETLREALRVPYVAITGTTGARIEVGTRPDLTRSRPLVYDGSPVGELTIGLRRGESVLGPADERVLSLLAGPVAATLYATGLAEALQTARERLVTAREAERRRVRRDLHDGLGPALTGLAFSADAAANLVRDDPEAAARILDEVRREIRVALADVRRLVDDLRPDAVDELGLVGALRRRADQLSRRSDGETLEVRLDLPDPPPELPAAVEVATYRIVSEALTNVARHAGATSAVVRIRCGDRLELAVLDDGPAGPGWQPGVGLRAMQDRTAELGGRLAVGPTPDGGRVTASIPMSPR